MVGSVGLDLTNDVEAHSRQRPVTPRIAGQASKHHHAHYQNDQQVFGLSGKGLLKNSGLSQLALPRPLRT